MSKISQISQLGEMLAFSNTIARKSQSENSANPSPRLGFGSRIVSISTRNTDANIILISVSVSVRKVSFSPDSPIIITHEPKQGEGFKGGIIFSSGGNNANGILNSVSESIWKILHLSNSLSITDKPLRRGEHGSRIDSDSDSVSDSVSDFILDTNIATSAAVAISEEVVR